MSNRTKLAGVTAVALAAAALPIGSAVADDTATAAGSKTYKTKVADDYFSPSEKKIKKNDVMKWKWLDTNGNPHNVTLKKGPDGVKKNKFTSATGSIGIKFKKTFKKKGTYDFICTVHPDVMKQTVKVKG